MKEKALLTLAFLCTFFYVFPQAEVPEFGNIAPADLSSGECSFEKDADAMVLINEGNYSFKASTYEFRVIYEQRVRI